MDKLCRKCNCIKSSDDFYNNQSSKDNLSYYCSKCLLDSAKVYYKANIKKKALYNKAWREENPKMAQNSYLTWKKENKNKVYASNAKRRADKLNATPKWLSQEQLDEILHFYIEAQEKTKLTGIPHHVDHIIPLKGNNVRGLHVPWNLQVLTESENCKKNNRVG
jgi:hypothetical protein